MIIITENNVNNNHIIIYMHLKNLGNSINAFSEIEKVFDKFKKTTKKNYNDVISQLKDSTKGYSLEVVQAAITRGKFTEEQMKATLVAKGLSGAELDAAMKTVMLDASQKKATATTLGFGTAIKGAGLEIKNAASNLKNFIAANASTLSLAAGLGFITTAIYALYKSQQELQEKSKELTRVFIEEEKSINVYKGKIEELQITISSSSSSIADAAQARKDLISIQNELIQKYGTEKSTIDIITESINEQADALDRLSERKYQEWKNDFNDKSFWQSVSDWIFSPNMDLAFSRLIALDFKGAGEALTQSTESNIDKMITTMRSAHIKIEKSGNDTLDKLIQESYNPSNTFGDSKFVFYGNLDEVYEKLIEIQQLAANFQVDENFSNSLTKAANIANKNLQSFENAYNNYILYEKILTSSKDNVYDDYFASINGAKRKYDDEIISGDDEKSELAFQNFATILNEAITKAFENGDNDIAKYFSDMYPELREMFGSWEFDLNFTDTTKNLEQTVQNALTTLPQSVEGILEFQPEIATDEQVEAYGQLKQLADEYNLTLEQLISLLEKKGLVSSESYIKLKEQFGDTIDSLSREDLEIAYKIVSDESNLSWEELLNEIEDTKAGLSELSSCDEISIQINNNANNLIDEYEILKTILSDTGNVSKETYDKLLSCSTKYATALETQNGKLHINRARLLAVSKQRTNDVQETIKQANAQNKLEYLRQANELGLYKNALTDTTSEAYQNIASLQNQITQYDMLTNQLNNATDAFQNFRDAQNINDKEQYDTSTSAFNTVTEALESGQVGTEKMRSAMELLMEDGQYDEFLRLGRSKDNPAEKQYLFMEKWANTNLKFFGEDEKQNAMNFVAYMEQSGLLADGVLATSQEIGKQTGLSVDAINSLVELLNLYGFQDIVQQEPTDYLDNYIEKLQNYQDAKEKLAEAKEGNDSNIISGLENDFYQAEQKYEQFMQEIPNKFIEMKEQFVESGTDISLGDWLTGEMGEENAMAFLQSVHDRLTAIGEEQARLDDQYQNPAYQESSFYQELLQEQELFQNIQDQLIESNSTFIKEEDVELFASLISRMQELQEISLDNASIEEYGTAQEELAFIQGQLDSLAVPTLIQIDIEKGELEAQITEIDEQVKRLETQRNATGSEYHRASLDSAINTAQDNKKDIKNKLEEYEVTVTYITETGQLVDATADINESETKNVDIDVDGIGDLRIAKALIDLLQDKTVVVDIQTTGSYPIIGGSLTGNQAGSSGEKEVGNPPPQPKGPSAADGTAHANGNWALKKNESGSLVGELGREIVVRNGRFFTVGDSGAEFVNLRRGDIVFNHKQTRNLLQNGYVTSRGHMIGGSFAEGSAFNNANNKYTGTNFFKPAPSNSSQSTKNSDSAKKSAENATKAAESIEESAEKTNDKFKELFDWIERRVKYFQKVLDKWLKQAGTALTNTSIKRYYKKAAKNLDKLLSSYAKGASKYKTLADNVPLDEKYKKKVRNKSINIESITDDKLAEKIKQYQDYYDKASNYYASFIESAEKLYKIPIDKAATKIERFSDSITLLDKKLNNAIGAKEQNKIIDSQLRQEKNKLKAYEAAKKEANDNFKKTKKATKKSAKLTKKKSDKSKVKNAIKAGKEINLALYKEGSKGYNAAVKYNEALKANKKATQDYNVASEEYKTTFRKEEKAKFDNIAKEYKNEIGLLNNKIKSLDNEISVIEAKGLTVGRDFYEVRKNTNAETLKMYQNEKAALEKMLDTGTIKKGTDEWYEAKDQIQQCADAIADCEKNTISYNKAINELNLKIFKDIADQIERVKSEYDFLTNLMSHEKMYDENGTFTNAGLGTLGGYAAKYHANLEKITRDKELLDELTAMLNSGSLSNGNYIFNSKAELQSQIDEVYKTWQDDIKDTYSAQKSIYDMMDNKYKSELDALKKLIDDKKKALDLEKNLYDYQKKITEKNKKIETIKKQMAAYSGDNSQEAQAKLQKLQLELNNAQEDLKETEYDKYISDQKDMLDKMYEEYQELIKKKLEDFMNIVEEGLQTVENNTANISSALDDIASQYGYDKQYGDVFGGDASVSSKLQEIITLISNTSSANIVSQSGNQTTRNAKTSTITQSNNVKPVKATANANATILTQDFTKIMPDAMNTVKEFTKFNLPNLNKVQTLKQTTPINNNGDVSFNFELPNATDAQGMIQEIARSTNLQKAIQSVTIDRINGGARLAVNRYK